MSHNANMADNNKHEGLPDWGEIMQMDYGRVIEEEALEREEALRNAAKDESDRQAHVEGVLEEEPFADDGIYFGKDGIPFRVVQRTDIFGPRPGYPSTDSVDSSDSREFEFEEEIPEPLSQTKRECMYCKETDKCSTTKAVGTVESVEVTVESGKVTMDPEA